MGKRTDFPRVARDFYPTPPTAVRPLIAHLPHGKTFWEPCAGDGRLAMYIENMHPSIKCGFMSDIEPQPHPLGQHILKADAMTITATTADMIITNTPWPAKHGRGEPTLSFIHHFAAMKPTWLLLASDFAHNVYFSEVVHMCQKIVSVGRVSWMANGVSGMENAAWYLFDAKWDGQTQFYGRVP